MARSSSSQSNLAYAALAWGGVALTTFVVRKLRQRKLNRREERVVKEGGLLPDARNVVHALQIRATDPGTKKSLALTGADGTAYTWSNYYEETVRFAEALQSVSSSGSDGVAVHAFNCPRWFFSAAGALAAGWTVSGIYLTNTYDQAVHILKTSHVKVLVIENETMMEQTYAMVLQDFPYLTVVLLETSDDFSASDRVLSYDAFVKKGTDTSSLIQPSDLPQSAVATLVYTSGTTGNPKAVELTHGNIHEVCKQMHGKLVSKARPKTTLLLIANPFSS
jgi:long-subunit acyl-CoA synthetase (AMP-forming)